MKNKGKAQGNNAENKRGFRKEKQKNNKNRERNKQGHLSSIGSIMLVSIIGSSPESSAGLAKSFDMWRKFAKAKGNKVRQRQK